MVLQFSSVAQASWHYQRLLSEQNQQTGSVTPSSPTVTNPTPTSPSQGVTTPTQNLSVADQIKALRNGTQVAQPSQPTQTTPTQPAPNQNTGQTPVTTAGLSAQESQMLQMLNAERQNNGLKPLQSHSQLISLARTKSQDMVNNNYFSHTSPTYGSFYHMVYNAGIPFRQVGENIALSSTAQKAFYQFMGSSGHKQNILSPHFTHVGIGIVPNQQGVAVTQLFIAQ